MFCAPDSSFTFWQDDGVPLCFHTVLSSVIPFVFIFIFGIIQICIYGKHSRNNKKRFKKNLCLFVTQILLTAAMVMESLVRMAIETTSINKKRNYGSILLNCALSFSMWIMSVILLVIERQSVVKKLAIKRNGYILMIFWILVFIIESSSFISWRSKEWFWKLENATDYKRFGLWLFRYICVILIFIISVSASATSKRNYLPVDAKDEKEKEKLESKKNKYESTWKGFFSKLRLISSYLWPKKDILLQLNVIFCVFLLIVLRVTGLLSPIFSKKIVDKLSSISENYNKTSTTENSVPVTNSISLWPWDLICISIFLRFLQGGGGSGFIDNLKSSLWVKVEQYTSRNIAGKLFSHLHNLSLKWHLSRKTGEVLRVVSRGTGSLNNLVEYLLFSIVPTIIDIIIATFYFIYAFNMWFGIIVFTSVALYLGLTILITEWRSKYRRELIEQDNNLNSRAVDSLLNFETVKYFNAEKYELEKYLESYVKYQKVELTSTWSLWLLNSTQNFVVCVGLLTGSLYCAWLVTAHEGLTVGDYVLFSTFVLQLYAPLNRLGMYYRIIQQAFIDMEKMFDLFDEDQDIKDDPNAKQIDFQKGLIEFEKVHFSYSTERPCLKGISFRVLPGQTVAVVGPSGAGKSTIVRLLFRFYDINSGSIKIDGQDIRFVTQESLRKLLGVVPQDTVLFNNDIRYNIRYGRVNATDDEVQNAAAASDLHNPILTFEKGYDTVVGERGLKLSGGEKQRVAIARTILKAPQIVLLDEATSALDTKTERNIQSSLQKVCENRTTIVIAHRLSTIVNADQILVLKDGEIAESGTHAELLKLENGIYASMWNQQQESMNEALNKSDN